MTPPLTPAEISETMSSIRAAVKLLRDFNEEQSQMDAMESNARKDLDAAAEEGSLKSEKVRQKISRSQQNLDLCAARRGAVERGIVKTSAALTVLARKLDSQWTRTVLSIQKEYRENYYAANVRYHVGNENAFAREIQDLDTPELYEINRAHIHFPKPFPLDSYDLLNVVCGAIRHIRRHAKRLNIQLDSE